MTTDAFNKVTVLRWLNGADIGM